MAARMSYREKLRHVPVVLRRMRLRAGHTSVRSAIQAIRKKTGFAIGRPTISKWENGRATPNLTVLVTFLEGLGYDLKAFQDALDHAAGEGVPEPGPAGAGSMAVERRDPEVHEVPQAGPDEDDWGRRFAEVEERLRRLENGEK